MMKKLLSSALLLTAALTSATAQNVLDVNTKKTGAPIQSTMYGIFFEDINYAADGGLYGELVKNRSFEFPDHLMGWQAFGKYDVEDDENSIQRPELITPQKGTAQVVAGKKQATVSDQLPAMSFRIYRIKK